jgi:alpha-L-fucosidase
MGRALAPAADTADGQASPGAARDLALAAPSRQVVAVAATDSAAAVIARAASVVPSPRRLAWQRLKRTAFIHFGVNTFDGLEWGTGTEDPNLFQPAGLDTDQWAVTW